MNLELTTQIQSSSEYIKARLPFTPELAIILGSGLGPLSAEIDNPIVFDYTDIPGFKPSTVAGHAGQLIAGMLNGKKVLVMNGRFHYYEGHEMDVVTFPIRVFNALGIRNIIITNAAGGLREDLHPGSIMLINDHLSFMCPSPLRGPNIDTDGTRFPDMTHLYTPALLDLAHRCALSQQIQVSEGVYCYFRGPQYETPAEIRGARILGADAAGMSTVPEAIVARHCGMNILGISLITNKAAGLFSGTLSHNDVKETAAKAEADMVNLVKEIVLQLQI